MTAHHAPLPPLRPPLSCCRSMAAIVDKYGFGDGATWMANWQAAWQANLDACGPGPEGDCKIH